MQNQLQSLLKQISKIIKEENELKLRKYEHGETFNVFEVLRLQRNEVRLHSSLIAALLAPNGPHGLKTKSLECFLRVIDAEGILDDLSTVKAEREMYIGPISKKGDDGGRMDIVLMDKHENAIVIENKIDAKDQPKQLLRYDNYCKKHFNNYRIYYLTKWGDDCSDESCGGREIRHTNISYDKHILTWLEECIKLSEDIRPVNETIKQYITNLFEILNIMSQNNENELISVVTSDENIESTLAILENQKYIGKKIRIEFLQELLSRAKEYGFEGNMEEAEALADMNTYSYLYLKSPKRSSLFAIFIGNETPAGGFWYSIGATTKRKVTKKILPKFEQQWGTYEPDRKSVNTPYGWDFFWSESGDAYSGQWWKWDDPETLRAMHNGRLLSFIEKRILKHTVEHHLLEDLEKAVQ